VNAEDLATLLRERRSVRRFEARPVPREAILRLLEAAVAAPSASNKQPWRFFVVEDRARIERMAAAVREATARVAARIPEADQPAFRAYGDYFTRFEAAPTVIVPLYRPLTILSHLARATGDGPDDRVITRMEDRSGLIGTSLALENLLLMAHATGLGASGMTGPLLAEPALRDVLDVPNGWEIVALVPVGYPAETPAPTDRKPVDKVVRWL
jgi:nitroreductase